MESKTYFFRDEYSVYEMIQRISKEDLVDLVNNYLPDPDITTKEEAISFLIENFNEEEQREKVTPYFLMYGKKGDNLNVQLYLFENKGIDILSEDHIKMLNNLKGKSLNSLPFIGAFCKEPCELVDVRVDSVKETIDYKFKFELFVVEEDQGKIKSKKNYLFIECRHYLDKNIIAVVDSRKTERKIALNIIFVLPFYIKLTLSADKTKVEYSNPDYSEIVIFPAQLHLLKHFLRGKLKSTELLLEGENGVKVRIDGNSESFEDESNFLKLTMKKGISQDVAFYYTDSSNNKSIVYIKSNAQIISSACVDENTLDQIISKVNRVDGYKEFMYPFSDLINEYCYYIKRGMVTRAKIRRSDDVLYGLETLVNEIIKKDNRNFIPSPAYLNIAINICILLLKSDTVSPPMSVTDIIISKELKLFFELYLLEKYNIQIDNEKINKVISILYDLVSSANDRETILMETCIQKYIREE